MIMSEPAITRFKDEVLHSSLVHALAFHERWSWGALLQVDPEMAYELRRQVERFQTSLREGSDLQCAVEAEVLCRCFYRATDIMSDVTADNVVMLNSYADRFRKALKRGEERGTW